MSVKKAQKLAAAFSKKLKGVARNVLQGKVPTSEEMGRIPMRDMADLIKYCDLIENGKLNKAYKMQSEDMDTACYERIPHSLYDVMQSFGANKVYE